MSTSPSLPPTPGPGDTGMFGYLLSLVHGDGVMPRAGGHTGQQPCAIWGCGAEQPEHPKNSHDQHRGDWDGVRRRDRGGEGGVCVKNTCILNSLIIPSAVSAGRRNDLPLTFP